MPREEKLEVLKDAKEKSILQNSLYGIYLRFNVKGLKQSKRIEEHSSFRNMRGMRHVMMKISRTYTIDFSHYSTIYFLLEKNMKLKTSIQSYSDHYLRNGTQRLLSLGISMV